MQAETAHSAAAWRNREGSGGGGRSVTGRRRGQAVLPRPMPHVQELNLPEDLAVLWFQIEFETQSYIHRVK